MSYISHDWDCPSCGVFNELVERDNIPDTVWCPMCGADSPRVWTAPLVMRQSFHDGVRRKGFQELKEANKLKKEARKKRQEGDREGAKALKREAKKITKL